MSFGEEIRRERELRQISLREVAHATKINLRYLEAMERNDFAYLPGGLFNRAFVRAYSEHIGVDSETMVNAYLLEEQAQAGVGKGADGDLLRGSAVGGSDDAFPAGDTEESTERSRRRRLLRRGLGVLLATLIVVALLYALRLFLPETGA
jgi:cytoskeletal protein RodZ